MGRPVIPQRRKNRKARPQPKHRMDGTFKVSKVGKYNAQGQKIDGHFFASKAEAARYCQLKRLLEAKRIEKLELQPKYPITIDGIPICTYIGDFRYVQLGEYGNAVAIVVEDVKGMITPEYRLKSKLFQAKYRMPLHELPAQWVDDYEGLTGPECMPIIKEKGDVKEARRKAKLAKRRAQRKLDAMVDKAGPQETDGTNGND